MATRRKRTETPSESLFDEQDLPDHPDGFIDEGPQDSPAQQAARKGATAVAQVVQQPMPSIALKPMNGAITRQMMLTWLKIVREIQQQPKADTYKIPMPVLMDFLGDKSNYERLKSTLRSLNAVQVEWNEVNSGGTQWTVSSLLSQAKIIRSPSQNIVEVSLPPDISRGVRELEQFSELNLIMARELKNQSALNLYRIAVAYETNPSKLTFRKPPEEWDMYLRVKPQGHGAAFEYKYFKRDTLLPAIEEVNRLTHLNLELIEHKEGRVVVEIQFRIEPKTVEVLPLLLGDAAKEAIKLAEAELRALGLKATEAISIVTTYGSERVMANVAYVKQRSAAVSESAALRNPTAYLKAAIKNNYADGMVFEEQTNTPQASLKPNQEQAERDAKRAKLELISHRRTEAHNLFLEMTRRESDNIWHEYLNQMDSFGNKTLASTAKRKGLEAKIVQVHFYDWLAVRLWGEPDEQAITNFSQASAEGKA